VTLVVACALLILMLRWFEYSQVYHPDRVLGASGAELGRPFQDVLFASKDGVELNGWFYPALTNSARGSMVLLICHGNAGNISHRLGLCEALLSTGVNVFLFDYRGYGRSRGRPSEQGTYLDAQAAYDWLVKKGFAGKNIVVLGESLGGGVGSELALRAPTGALILISTFTSITDIGRELFPWLPVRLLASIKYDTCSKLPQLRVPVLVMHSREDKLIAFRHCQNNYAAANEPKLLWEIKGSHGDSLADREAFINGIEKFFQLIKTAGSATEVISQTR